MHRFWKWLKLIAPVPKPGRLLTPVRKHNLSPSTHVHAQIREIKGCSTCNSELSNSIFSSLLSLVHSSIVWFEFALFLSAFIDFLFCLFHYIFSLHPSLPDFIMIYHLLRTAHATTSFCAIVFLLLTHSLPSRHRRQLSARSDQPGRALTWCTTTCWLTWTGPVWTCQAAVAACHGQNCPLTSRRTLTMTPSGPATVTGWVRCRVRAASLTRTKCTVLPRCNVMWCPACLPLTFGVSKETSIDLFCIYLFLWHISSFLLTYLSYLFLDSLF